MDLKKYIDKLDKANPPKMMDPKLVKSYLYQINDAILFCHKRRVLHRDLKPQNLLITNDGTIKVSLHILFQIIIVVLLFTNLIPQSCHSFGKFLLISLYFC